MQLVVAMAIKTLLCVCVCVCARPSYLPNTRDLSTQGPYLEEKVRFDEMRYQSGG